MKLISLSRLRGHSSLAAGFVAQALLYGSGLFLLPFVVTRLSAPEIGIWYLFLTIQGLASLADFGFQPTFSRAFSAAYAGARELRKQGLAEALDRPNLNLVEDILRLCRRFYLGMAGAVLLILLVGGTAYIRTVVAGEPLDFTRIEIVWVLFSLGSALSCYFWWTTTFLLGGGRVASNYLCQIVSQLGYVAIGLALLTSGWGLLGLAWANIAAVLIARILATFLMRPLRRPLADVAKTSHRLTPIFQALWPNASRMGMVALGAFLITRVNVIIVSSFFDLAQTAAYAVSLQLLLAVTSIGHLPTQVVLPQMVKLRVSRDLAGLRKLFLKRQAFLVLVLLAGMLLVAFAAQPLLSSIGSRVHLLPTPLLLLLGLVLMLEANHSNCGLVITTNNNVPFVAPALLSGLGVALLATLSAWAGYGIAGVVISQGIVQLAYNNWKWPLVLGENCRMSLFEPRNAFADIEGCATVLKDERPGALGTARHHRSSNLSALRYTGGNGPKRAHPRTARKFTMRS